MIELQKVSQAATPVIKCTTARKCDSAHTLHGMDRNRPELLILLTFSVLCPEFFRHLGVFHSLVSTSGPRAQNLFRPFEKTSKNGDTPFTYFHRRRRKSARQHGGKNIAFDRLLFPSHICLGPIGEDSGRTPADKAEPEKINLRACLFFTSVTDNVCKKRFFVPSVTGKIQSFTSLGVAAGDRQFFLPSVTENVCKERSFFPSVTDNVCKNDFFTSTCAKIGIFSAGIDLRNRGKKSRALDGRVSPPIFSRRGGLLFAQAAAGSIVLRRPKSANAIFCSSVTGENT